MLTSKAFLLSKSIAIATAKHLLTKPAVTKTIVSAAAKLATASNTVMCRVTAIRANQVYNESLASSDGYPGAD